MAKSRKKAQVSTEYIIVVGFIIFLIISTLGVAFFYANKITDKIKMDQIENYANKLISSSERVLYAGKPSRTVVNAYLPAGVNGLDIIENSLVFNVSTSTGMTRIAFTSNVVIEGSLSKSEGVKRISIVAEEDKAVLNEI